MQNFQVITEADKTWLQYELPRKEEVDSYLLSLLADKAVPALAEIRNDNDHDDMTIYYDITGMVPLSKLLKQVITIRQLCLMLKNTLESFHQMSDAMIEADKIYMNPSYIFVHPDDLQFKFLCIPSVRSFRHFYLKDFLRHIIYSAKLKGVTDPSVIKRITAYTSTKEQFNELRMLSYLNEVLGVAEEDNTFSLSGKLEHHSIQLKNPIEEPEQIKAQPEKESKRSENAIAVLTRLNTGEHIPIVKPIFRLGKDKESVDYQISGNTAISRCHAMIISRKSHFYVMDCNSTNHTYVNSSPVMENEEKEIFHGYRIGLGNELFYFEVIQKKDTNQMGVK